MAQETQNTAPEQSQEQTQLTANMFTNLRKEQTQALRQGEAEGAVSQDKVGETPESPEQKAQASDKKDQKTETSIDYREQFAKSEERGKEHQRFAHATNQKLKDSLKVLDALVEAGDLDEESAGKLYGILKKEGLKAPDGTFEEKISATSNHPFAAFLDVLDRDLFQTYQEVSEDAQAAHKLRAFDQYSAEADPDELQSLHKELEKLTSSPMALLKKILSVGGSFLEEGLGDFYQQGGFRKYLAKQKQDNEKLQKEIDTLKKKLLQYEDYESSGRFWIGNSSEGSEGESSRNTGNMYQNMRAAQKRTHRSMR